MTNAAQPLSKKVGQPCSPNNERATYHEKSWPDRIIIYNSSVEKNPYYGRASLLSCVLSFPLSRSSIFLIVLIFCFSADESENGIGLCGWLLTAISWGLVAVTLPFSLCVCFKVSQISGPYRCKHLIWYIMSEANSPKVRLLE